MAPLRALSINPNYFSDRNGKIVYLMGSHTWNDFQDWGTNGSPVPFDFDAYVNMLVVHNHNFTLLWQTELAEILWIADHGKFAARFYCGSPALAAHRSRERVGRQTEIRFHKIRPSIF